jgi:hypothetical protein
MIGTTQRKALVAMAMGVAALLASAAWPAFARTNHAVVIGVTDYPQLPKSNWLLGPKNDAVLVRDFLTTQAHVRFDPANVKLLTDGVEGAEEPTLAAILRTLDDLAEKVERDDFVYLQFSGHGFQQTAADPASELDGLDEIFLPKDTGRWVDRSKGMPNALVDDVIGEKLDAIRARGAFVWVVFDTCHSGTATRAAPGDDVVERKISPESVGMPAEVLTEAAAMAEGTRDLAARESPLPIDPTAARPAGEGGLVAFFAAQTNETTPEMPLPAGEAGATKYGLFTYTLFSKLAENPNVTYRQLAQGVLQHYTSINRTSTTPLFEGDLDHPVFGTELGDFVPQWPIEVASRGVTIPAGRLHGLAPGARLAIVEKAGDRLEDALGYLEVRGAENMTSSLAMASAAPEASAGSDAGQPARLRSLGDIPPGAYARAIETRFDFVLKVARPELAEEFAEAASMVHELLDDIAGDQSQPFQVEIVEPGAAADLRLAVLSEASLPEASFSASADPALWFLPESGELSVEDGRRPPSIVMQSGDRAALREAMAGYVARIYRATNLAKIGQASDYGPGDIDVSFTLRRADTDEMVEVTSTNVPTGLPGDLVHVLAVNNTSSDVDINLLYVGSDYSITWMGHGRMKPQGRFDRTFLEFTDESYGRELMVAVFAEAPPLSATQDLRFLEQQGLRQVTRGDTGSSIADLITQMGGGSVATTRAAKFVGDQGGKPRGSVLLYPMRTVPRP